LKVERLLGLEIDALTFPTSIWWRHAN